MSYKVEKGYKRKPIVLNHQAIVLLQVFKRRDWVIEDMWIADYIEEERGYQDDAEEAAKQFINQLEGENNGAFMIALAKECFRDLREHDKMTGTEWGKETLRDIRKENKDAI